MQTHKSFVLNYNSLRMNFEFGMLFVAIWYEIHTSFYAELYIVAYGVWFDQQTVNCKHQ